MAVMPLAALGEGERAKEWMSRALLIDPENMTMRYNFACELANHLNDKDGGLGDARPGIRNRWAPVLSIMPRSILISPRSAMIKVPSMLEKRRATRAGRKSLPPTRAELRRAKEVES